ncbi:hypothetical protein DFH08DRAFT_971216 [Mycena albidolilacea]|uniref:FCP1 homology domain-containing protein n=1 Tax=Mycena albidolilacea TaxID=1033008 RepID=A0AAD7EEX8_9AGAR|nr:hypothetical protein DFH08DRAFT_971216 [Mycena albidolilacea]
MSAQAPRKLLVLDLNGTLLSRSKRTRRGPSAPNPGITRSQLVHPRPYLGTFKEYILHHPSTKKWLNAMVWSSAQPHSVADMLRTTASAINSANFWPSGLVTRWGSLPRFTVCVLSSSLLVSKQRPGSQLYNACVDQKTQTTKDLIKPWATFPEHSHRTTLLLDESTTRHAKHTCIRIITSASANTLRCSLRGYLVVGILETVKSETDVAKWIRGGGLLAAGVADTVVEQAKDSWLGALANQMAALNLVQEVWFNSEATVNHWVGRGVLALEALQIPLGSTVSIHEEILAFRSQILIGPTLRLGRLDDGIAGIQKAVDKLALERD